MIMLGLINEGIILKIYRYIICITWECFDYIKVKIQTDFRNGKLFLDIYF